MRSYLEKKEHFGLRKLSTGLASVLLATTFMTAGHSQTVHADSTNKDDHESTDENVPENDTKDFMTQDEDNSQEVKINYVNANNETVSTQIAHLNKGDKITYAVPDGYKTDNDLADKFDGEKTEITVNVTKQEVANPQEQNKQENAKEVADNDKQASPSQQETKKQTEKADSDQAKAITEKAKTDTVKDDANTAKPETAKTDSTDQTTKVVKPETKQAEKAETAEKVAEPVKADSQTANKDTQAKPSSKLKSSLIDQKANESTSVVNANANGQDDNQAKPQKTPLDKSNVEKATENLLDDSANYFDDTPISSLIDTRANSFMAAPLGVVDSRVNDESNRNLTARLNALYGASFIATGGGSNPNYPNLTIDNWTDPTAWGMVKTSVGWIYPDRAGNFRASQSDSYLYSGDHNRASGQHQIGLKDMLAESRLSINATIDQATANKSTNQDVLLVSIPRLINDPDYGEAGHISGFVGAGLSSSIKINRTIYDKYGNEIGTLWVGTDRNTAQVWFHNTGSNYSSDVNIKFDCDYLNRDLGWPNNYQYMAKTGKTFSEIFANSDGSTVRYDHVYNPAQDDTTYPYNENTTWSNPNNLVASAYWSVIHMGSFGAGFNQPLNNEFHRVISFSYQDETGKIVPVSGVGSLHAITSMRLTNGTDSMNSYRYDLYSVGHSIRLADNLSAKDVYDQTPVGSTSYSMQKDGSILLGYNVNTNQFKYEDWQIQEAIDSQYYFNYQHPEQKDQWLQATLDAYHKHNMNPVSISGLEQVIDASSDKHYNALTVDVTPNGDSHTVIDRQQGNTADGQAGYVQNALVKYVDQNTGKQISVQPIMGGQDKDVKFVDNVPSDYVLVNNTDRDFTYHFTYDNNPDKTIYVMPKIVGQSTRNMKENADGLLNYDLSQVRGDPNVQIIQDDDKVFNVDPKDPNSLYNQARAIGDDYDNQDNTIYQQIEQYEQELAKYNKAKAQYIDQLKTNGLWTNDAVDPSTIKQNLHLDLNDHNNSIRPVVSVTDLENVEYESSLSPDFKAPQWLKFKTNNAIPGMYAKLTYMGITNSYYGNRKIAKMVVTLSNVKAGALNADGCISIVDGINNGFWRDHIAGTDMDIQFYDDNNNLITFGDDAYLTVGSLNGHSNSTTEAVKLLSDGNPVQLPQSGVKVHADGGMYMDDGKDYPEALGLPSSFDNWDSSTEPNRIFGSAMIHVKGNHIKLRTYNLNDYTQNDNIGTNDPWFIWSTLMPQMSFDQQPPKLVLHYHNNVLQESISPEYKIIQQKPDGTSVTLTDIHPTFERTGAVNLVDKSVDWYIPSYLYNVYEYEPNYSDGWSVSIDPLSGQTYNDLSGVGENIGWLITDQGVLENNKAYHDATGSNFIGFHDYDNIEIFDPDHQSSYSTHVDLSLPTPEYSGYVSFVDNSPVGKDYPKEPNSAGLIGLFGSNDPLQMHDNTTTIHYGVERDWRVIEDMPDGSQKVVFELKGAIPLLPDGKYGVNHDYNWLRQYLPYGHGLNQSIIVPGLGDSTFYNFNVDTKDGYTTVFSNLDQDAQYLNYNQAINLYRNADGTWTFDLFCGDGSEYSTLAPSHDWHIKYTPTITQTQENDQSHFVIQQQNPNPVDHGDLYQQKIGDRSVLYRFSTSGHRTKYHNEVTGQDTYGNWTIDHFYAPDSQGVIHDLGSAEFTQDSAGQWGFWDVFNKYAPEGYMFQPDEVYTPYGKGPNIIPGYDLQSTVADSGTVHFDGNSSWITFDNLDTPDDVANMVSGNHTVTISYTPVKNQNTISYQLTDPTNPDKNIHDHFNTGLADAITTDQVGTIGLNSYKNAVNKNMYESYQTVLQNSYVDSIKVSVNGQDKVYKFRINGDNTISIILPDGRTMTESQYEAYAKQNLDPIRGFSLKTVTDRDGNVRISPESMVAVSDETLPVNSDDYSTNDGALTNERNDDLPTMFRMYAPSITYNLQAMGNKKTQEDANNEHVSDTFTIHYNIPEQMSNYTDSTTENDVYKIVASRDQHTEYDWEDLGYANPIYDMEPDGNGGYEMVQVGSEEAYGYVPHQIDTGWYDADLGSDDANQISVDDIVANKLSDSAPFVFNDKATPMQAGGYRLVIYGYDKSGKRVDLTNDLSHFVTINRSDGSTDYYFAPYYNKGLSNFTDYIGNYLNDDTLSNDIYVTYEPIAQTKPIEYVDVRDYPDKDQGQLVATDQISGMQSSTVTVQYHIPAGYVKDETGNEEVPDTYTFNPDDNNTPIIVYIHAVSNINQDSHTYHRTIKFAGDFDGSSITWDNDGLETVIEEGGNTGSSFNFAPGVSVKVIPDNDGNIGTGSWDFSHSESTNTLTGETTDGEWIPDTGGFRATQVGLTYDPATKTVRGLRGILNLPEGYHAYLNGDRNNKITEINEATIDQESPDQDIVITITKGDVGQKVEYVDDNGNVVGQEENPLEGQIGDKVSLNLAIPAGYDLAKSQSDPSVNITSSDPNNPVADITITKEGVSKIHVTMSLIPVYHYDPKTPEDVLPGKDPDDSNNYFPQGVGKYDLNRTITRTINVNLPSGGYTIIQKVVLYRDAWVNPGNKAVTFMDSDTDHGYGKGTGWKFDAKNSSETVIQTSGMGAFKQFNAPQVDGYAPSISTVNEYAPLPDDLNTIVNINYAKTDNQVTVVYDDVDQTGKEITRYHMNKDAQGNGIGVTLTVPDGYDFATETDRNIFDQINSGNSASIPTNYGNPSLFTIHFKEKMQDIANSDPAAQRTIKRQVVIVNPDNTRDSVTIEVHMKRQAIYNEVTKSTHYGDWKVASVPVTIYDHNLDNDENDGIVTGDLLKGDKNDEFNKFFGNNTAVVTEVNGHTAVIIPRINIPTQNGYATMIDNANSSGVNLSNEYVPMEVLLMNTGDKINDQLGTETTDMTVTNTDNSGFDQDQDLTKTIVAHYVADEHEMTYKYVDIDNNQTIKGDSVIGNAGDTVDLDNELPDGYKLADGQTNFPDSYTFSANDKRNQTKIVYVKNTNKPDRMLAPITSTTVELYTGKIYPDNQVRLQATDFGKVYQRYLKDPTEDNAFAVLQQLFPGLDKSDSIFGSGRGTIYDTTEFYSTAINGHTLRSRFEHLSDTPMSARSALDSFADAISDLRDADGKHARGGCIVAGSFKLIVSRDGKRQELTTKFDTHLPNADKSDYLNQRYQLGSVVRYNKVSKGTVNGMPVSGFVPEYGPISKSSDYEDMEKAVNDNSESEAEQILSKMVKQYHVGDKVIIDDMDVLNYLFPNIGGKEIYMSNDDSNALGVIKAIYSGAKDQFEYLNEHPVENDDTPRPIIGYVPLVITPKGNADDETVSATLQFGNDMEQIRQQYAERHPNHLINV